MAHKWPPDPEHIKALITEARELSARTVDNLDRKDVCAVATLGLTAKDLEALSVIAAADGRIRSYTVLIRRLILHEAKRLNGPA